VVSVLAAVTLSPAAVGAAAGLAEVFDLATAVVALPGKLVALVGPADVMEAVVAAGGIVDIVVEVTAGEEAVAHCWLGDCRWAGWAYKHSHFAAGEGEA
jgi:hypothetical protein